MKSAKQKKSLWTTLLLLLTVLSIITSCVGCSRFSFLNDDKTDTDGGSTIPTITPDDPPPTVYYNRYTGLACDEALSSCRPISVCIGNFDGKQQEGLSYADILVEAPIEGDKTRLWAILCNPSKAVSLSSVATVRDYMMPITHALGTVGAYAGTTDTVGVTATVHAGDNLDYLYHNLTATFTRDTSGTLRTNGKALSLAAESRGYSMADTGQALPYRLCQAGSTYTPNSNRIRSIFFRFSMANSVEFSYDEAKGVYFKEQSGASHIDPLTQEQLSYANVLLLFHNVNYYHTANNTSFSLDMTSGGDGYLYTGGGVVSVHWRYAQDGSLSVTDDSGALITVNRGKTYIGMLRVTDSVNLIAK